MAAETAKGKKVVDEEPPTKKRKTAAPAKKKAGGVHIGDGDTPSPRKVVMMEWSDDDDSAAPNPAEERQVDQGEAASGAVPPERVAGAVPETTAPAPEPVVGDMSEPTRGDAVPSRPRAGPDFGPRPTSSEPATTEPLAAGGGGAPANPEPVAADPLASEVGWAPASPLAGDGTEASTSPAPAGVESVWAPPSPAVPEATEGTVRPTRAAGAPDVPTSLVARPGGAGRSRRFQRACRVSES